MCFGVVLVGDEGGARLEHADAGEVVAQAEPVEDAQVLRQQQLADVEARVDVLLHHHHAAAALGEQRGGGRAGRAAADHQHVALRLRRRRRGVGVGGFGGVQRHGGASFRARRADRNQSRPGFAIGI